jgi:hypothetical protein
VRHKLARPVRPGKTKTPEEHAMERAGLQPRRKPVAPSATFRGALPASLCLASPRPGQFASQPSGGWAPSHVAFALRLYGCRILRFLKGADFDFTLGIFCFGERPRFSIRRAHLPLAVLIKCNAPVAVATFEFVTRCGGGYAAHPLKNRKGCGTRKGWVKGKVN